MFVERRTGRFVLALMSGVVLSACSPSASTAVPPVLAAVPPPAAAPVAPLVTGLPDFTGLVEQFGPAVVNLQVTEKAPQRPQLRGRQGVPQPDDDFSPFFNFPPNIPRGQPEPSRGEGSGFIVTADGYILTNAHVVKDASEVIVRLNDRREFEAKVVGFDERTDVAVIKIDSRDLPTVRLGDPTKLKPGQWVVAIGSPFGMQNSVTAGIVSATSRDLPSEQTVPFIQTDAAVNPGNSGGPLFNVAGEVVGINSQIFSPSGGYAGLSFAIPIDIANDVREQLVKTGKVTRGRIGVSIQPMTAGLAESFGLDRPRGALVNEVIAGGPAEKAGIKSGDIILSVDGRPVESDSSLPAMISSIRPGKSTELEVWTDRKLRKVTSQVDEFKEAGAPAVAVQGSGGAATAEPAVLGLTVRPLNPQERQQVETAGSLVIEAVTGPAEAAGVQVGDIILSVGARRVRTLEQLQEAVKQSPPTVALQVQRDGRQLYLSVKKQ